MRSVICRHEPPAKEDGHFRNQKLLLGFPTKLTTGKTPGAKTGSDLHGRAPAKCRRNRVLRAAPPGSARNAGGG